MLVIHTQCDTTPWYLCRVPFMCIHSFLFCACIHTSKFGFEFINVSCVSVFFNTFFINHSFTYIGKPMCSGYIGNIPSCDLAHALLSLGVGVRFAFLFFFFLLGFFFILLLSFVFFVLCTRRISFHIKPCLASWDKKVEIKDDLYNYQHLVICIFHLFKMIFHIFF